MTITDITQNTDNTTGVTDAKGATPAPVSATDTTTGDDSATDAIDPDPSDAQLSDAVRAAVEIGELVAVDPRILVVGANVRRDLALDKPFLRSIAERGVREPIIARRGADGVLMVRKGKRRTVAAVEVGRDSVPVLVEPGHPDTDNAPDGLDRAAREVRVERIVDQLEENQHRTGTSDADEVRAHQQLLDLGLTAGQIARRTHVPTARVKQTTTVARSELATAAMERYDLTLDQVAVIAEFDTPDGPDVEAVKALTVTAAKEPTQFAHVAQRLRDQRADTRQVADKVAELTGQGVRVLDPDDTGSAAQISGLRLTAQVPSGTELDSVTHGGCPGHAATVEVHRGWDREPQLKVVHWCTAPDENGHVARWSQVPMSDGDGEVARQLAEATEQAKAERRRVIANNRDWSSAAAVRRDWMRSFLARRTAPRDALTYIAATLAHAGHDLRRAMESGHPTACELLGLTPAGSVYAGRANPIEPLAATATPARATLQSLAVLLGAAEDATSRQTWRDPSAENRSYFAALRGWGYPLSPVEQLVLADTEPTLDQPQDAASGDGTEGGVDDDVVYTDGEAQDGASALDTAAEDTSTE